MMAVPLPSRPGYASGVTDDVMDDLSWNDIARLMRIFPGVNPRHAATALLLDAIEQAEAINRKGA